MSAAPRPDAGGDPAAGELHPGCVAAIVLLLLVGLLVTILGSGGGRFVGDGSFR